VQPPPGGNSIELASHRSSFSRFL